MGDTTRPLNGLLGGIFQLSEGLLAGLEEPRASKTL